MTGFSCLGTFTVTLGAGDAACLILTTGGGCLGTFTVTFGGLIIGDDFTRTLGGFPGWLFTVTLTLGGGEGFSLRLNALARINRISSRRVVSRSSISAFLSLSPTVSFGLPVSFLFTSSRWVFPPNCPTMFLLVAGSISLIPYSAGMPMIVSAS